jgi:hypothetical protein
MSIEVHCKGDIHVISFYGRDYFSYSLVSDIVDKVLVYYHDIKGQWRRAIAIWLFQVLNRFLDSYEKGFI